MLEFLPEQFYRAIQKINLNDLYEIRMRANCPTKVRFLGEYLYLSAYGLSSKEAEGLVATYTDIEETVLAAGKYSVYSVEEQLKQGFLTAESGERLGIAGRFVYTNGQPAAVRDYSSLCIRVPHSIVGCSDEIYERCLREDIVNLLLVSPPGQGKTTILRDLSRNISDRMGKNVLVCDERGEIAAAEVGKSADIYSFIHKNDGMEMGVRVMRPDVMITDEISLKELPAIYRAIHSGVKIIASFHAKEVAEIPIELREAFEKIVLLDGKIIGKIKEVVSL